MKTKNNRDRSSALRFVGAALSIGTLAVTAAAQYSVVAWGGSDPVPSPNSGFTAISGGGGHALALRTNGTVVAYGGNGDGQCNVPSRLKNVTVIEAGNRYSLAISGGSISAWGYNGNGQLNLPNPNKNFVALAAGWTHGVGLKSNGSIVCWGWNGLGQATPPFPNSGFVKVASRTYHSLGLKADGSIAAWGRNLAGECNVPFPNASFVSVACGGYYPDPVSGTYNTIDGWSMGLKSDGSIVVWGSDVHGLVSNAPTETGFVEIAAGNNHAIARRADGSVVCWGAGMIDTGIYPDYGQCMIPAPNTGFVAIDAYNNVSMALRAYP